MVIISQGHRCTLQRSCGWAAVRWMQHCYLEMVKLQQDGHELQFPFGLGAVKCPCRESIPQCRYGLRLSRLHPKAFPVWAVGVHQMVISKISPEQPDVLQTWFKSKCAPRLNSPAATWVLLSGLTRCCCLLSSCISIVTSIFWISLENERIAHLFSQLSNEIEKSALPSNHNFTGL